MRIAIVMGIFGASATLLGAYRAAADTCFEDLVIWETTSACPDDVAPLANAVGTGSGQSAVLTVNIINDGCLTTRSIHAESLGHDVFGNPIEGCRAEAGEGIRDFVCLGTGFAVGGCGAAV